MRQKIGGKKVQNWHRPLGYEAKKRRFIRAKSKDLVEDMPAQLEKQESLLIKLRQQTYLENGEIWWKEAQEGLDFKLKQYVESKFAAFTGQEWKQKLERLSNNELALVPLSQGELSLMLQHYDDGMPVFDKIIPIIQKRFENPSFLKLIKHIYEAYGGYDAIRNILIFSPFIIRSLDDCSEKLEYDALIRHLFVRYEPPAFLYKEWQRDNKSRWLIWFVLTAQGGSLKQIAPHFGWRISKKFQHYLYEAPEHSMPTEACRFAEIRCMGGSAEVCSRLNQCSHYLIDPIKTSTEVFRRNPDEIGFGRMNALIDLFLQVHDSLHITDKRFLSFWQSTVRWLIAYGSLINDEQCQTVLVWAVIQYFEQLRRNCNFSLEGRSLTNILQRSRMLREQRLAENTRHSKGNENLKWQNHGWDWCMLFDNRQCIFTELTSSQALREESDVMDHCVGSYSQKCYKNYSAIFSLKLTQDDGEINEVTIDVDPVTKKLVSALGYKNRSLSLTEEQIVDQWHRLVVKEMSE